MKKLLLAIGIFLGVANAIELKTITSTISQVDDKKEVIFFNAANAIVGQSGIAIKQIDSHNLIVAQIEVQSVESSNIQASFKEFKSISQKYLPTPRLKPEVGDKVILGQFYNKSIIIAPDANSYNKVLNTSKNIEFLHIDLFAAMLASDGINDPKYKHFKHFCNTYSVGLLHIVASNGLNVLDCQSFHILESNPLEISDKSDTQAPFFSRIAKIETGSLLAKFRSNKSKDYFSYYDDLLKESLRIFSKTKE